MNSSQLIGSNSFRAGKVVFKQLAQKQLDRTRSEDEVQPDSNCSSIFQSISEIPKEISSGVSVEEGEVLVRQVARLVQGTEKIGELIDDGKTVLVSKEVVIETSQDDIYNMRYIIYRKDNLIGQIKIRARMTEDARTEADEDQPFTFHQCSFFLCDTREDRPPSPGKFPVGISIACDQRIRFVDCAFIGMNFADVGQRQDVVEYMVFMDCFSKLNLELVNCYFRGTKGVLFSNFPVKSLKVKDCAFDHIESDCFHVTHPSQLKLKGSNFMGCKNQILSIKLFDDDLHEKTALKRTSVFASGNLNNRYDNSMVSGRSIQRDGYLGVDNYKKSSFHIRTQEFDRKKAIIIKSNHFSHCEGCLLIKGMKKMGGYLDELDIQVEDNQFDIISSNCLSLENVHAGRINLMRNVLVTCNSTAFKVIGCKASKDDIRIVGNNLSGVYNTAVHIDSSVVSLQQNTFLSSTCAVFLYLINSGSNNREEQLQDNHKDFIVLNSVKDSFLGSNYTHGAQNNVSIMVGTESVAAVTVNRIIMKENVFKEISQYGVMIQNCSASSIKIEKCSFTNVKEPIVINEREVVASRNNTRNLLTDINNSEFLQPSFCNTPRIGGGAPRGTIMLKGNNFQGSDNTLVKRHVWSYLYDIKK